MTYKDKLAYLNGYRDALASVRETTELIIQLRTNATATTPNMDGLPHGSGVSDKVGTAAAIIADLEAQLLEEKAESLLQMARIERLLIGLGVRDRKLMHLRYIDGKSWQDVADEMHIDIWHAMKLRKRIIEKDIKI